MREIRNAFLQQRTFYTEARQGQKILGKNRATVFQGRHLLGPERFNLNTENREQWKTKKKKIGEWKWINVLLLVENCTFIVVGRCSLNFAELLYLLASLMKTPFRWSRSAQGLPPCPCRGWSCRGAEAQPRYMSQSPGSVRGGHTCLDLLMSDREQCDLETCRGTGKVNRTHGCSQLLKKLSMFFVCELYSKCLFSSYP